MAEMATISECRYRWLRLRDLNLSGNNFVGDGFRASSSS